MGNEVISYNLGPDADWREGYTPPESYTPGVAQPLPTKDDVVKSTEPADFGGWYENDDFSGAPMSEIPAFAAGEDYNLYAKWVRFTPDASGQPNEIDILTSGIYQYDYQGHNPIRVLFGVKQVSSETGGTPVGTIEVRDANTGEFLYDYTRMQQMSADNADIKRLTIGRYVISPHTSSLSGAVENDSLLIEYMGD